MEHEKKKKQKKKKNKQGKTSVPACVGELTSENNNHTNVTKQNHQNLNSDNTDVQNRGLHQTVVDSDRESISGAETSRSMEAEKSYWLNREASLEQKIKELQEQLDVHVQREADLERNISQSQKERNLWHHKETELETRILQLQTEKDAWLQEEVSFDEKRIQMEEEKAKLAQREMSFNEKHIQMEEEKAKLAQREMSFNEKHIQMEEEKAKFAQRENSAVETVASLTKDNARLRAQVIELEASRNNISHQNLQLKEHVSDLQSRIQDLENSLATRLSSEKKKVNILNTELDQKTATTQSSSPIEPDDPIKNPKAATDMDETSASETDPMSSSTENLETVSNGGQPSDLNLVSRVSMGSGEIVQISLEENDVTVATSATSVPEKIDPVPLTDAPLIGAPFRLISFVARYVSGADLVQT